MAGQEQSTVSRQTVRPATGWSRNQAGDGESTREPDEGLVRPSTVCPPAFEFFGFSQNFSSKKQPKPARLPV